MDYEYEFEQKKTSSMFVKIHSLPITKKRTTRMPLQQQRRSISTHSSQDKPGLFSVVQSFYMSPRSCVKEKIALFSISHEEGYLISQVTSFEVIVGGSSGGGGAAAAAPGGGGAPDAEAPPAPEKKEEKEESDDDLTL
ncbi:large ribosomal subunit protein P3-like [Cornus florida]|uniref:large ribosomal subunit protein P3-like n=1 Tax=Cornus florida TaxID=4283 RepID=UPI0028A0DD8F|nr:large ribosomal subunit protein P3-like [Cornus florida]